MTKFLFKLLAFIFVTLSIFVSQKATAVINDLDNPLVITKDHPSHFNTVALVKKNFEVFCTGSILSNNKILTAKHCLANRDESELFIYFGDNTNKLKKSLLRPISKVHFFGNRFDGRNTFPSMDIAWAQFEGKLPRGKRPLKLLLDKKALKKGSAFHLAGYGDSARTKWTLETGVKKVTQTILSDYFDTNILMGLMLFDGEDGRGACSGDSGGPAYLKHNGQWYLSGITNGFDVTLTPMSMRRTYKEQFPYEIDCKYNQILYTFSGDIAHWLEESTNEDLGCSNFNCSQPNKSSTSKYDFKSWCENVAYGEKGWVTVKGLLEFAADNAPAHIPTSKIFKSCQIATDVLNNLKNAYIKKEYKMDSLQPLRGLEIENLILIKRNLSGMDLSVFADMPKLRALNLANTNLDETSNIDKIFTSKTLELVDLATNNIGSLNITTRNYSLETLDLSGNPLNSISSMEYLSKLEYLYLDE